MFEPGNICYLETDSKSVIVISCGDKTAKVCPRGGGSTFSVSVSDLRYNDGTKASDAVASPPDSQLHLGTTERKRKKSEE